MSWSEIKHEHPVEVVVVHKDGVHPRTQAVVGDKITGVFVPAEEIVTLLVYEPPLHQFFSLHDVQVGSCGIVITGYIYLCGSKTVIAGFIAEIIYVELKLS